PPKRDPRPPRLVLAPRVGGVDELDFDPGGAQPLEPSAGFGARVEGAGHDLRHPRLEDAVDARRRVAMVRARLERHVERRAPRAPPRPRRPCRRSRAESARGTRRRTAGTPDSAHTAPGSAREARRPARAPTRRRPGTPRLGRART